MGLEDKLNKVSQMQRDQLCAIPFTGGTQRSEIHRHSVERGLSRPGVEGVQSQCLMRAELQFEKMKTFWKQTVVMFTRNVNGLEATAHLKMVKTVNLKNKHTYVCVYNHNNKGNKCKNSKDSHALFVTI